MKNLIVITAIVAGYFFWSARIAAQNDAIKIDQVDSGKSSSCYDSAFYINCQGDQIFYRKWGNPVIKSNDKVILMIHGIGYHSHPYKKIMNYLNDDSVLVYAMDLRGHGLSEKEKGNLESNEKILSDIDNMIVKIKNDNPNSKIYLVGSSMGGVYALGYAISYKLNPKISGLILVGPAIKVPITRYIRLEFLKLLWLSVFNEDKPGVRIDGKNLGKASRDSSWINLRRNDTLALHYVNAKYLKKLHEMKKMDRRKKELALINLPILIQHGGKDKVISPKGSYYLNENLKNAKTKLIVYPESYHSLFWDNDSNQVFDDIAHWIKGN